MQSPHRASQTRGLALAPWCSATPFTRSNRLSGSSSLTRSLAREGRSSAGEPRVRPKGPEPRLSSRVQTLSEIKAMLEERGLRPKRSLGQNFLIDHNLIRKLVDASGVGPGSLVLEVGPGTGTMTE